MPKEWAEPQLGIHQINMPISEGIDISLQHDLLFATLGGTVELSHIITFNLALIVALASPGPALLVAIKTTLTSGRKSGVAVGLGLGLVASLWTLAALLGLEALFILFPWAYIAVKFLGASYLLYTAYGMWMGARKQIASDVKPTRHSFRQGIIINSLNPKSVLFAAAVLVVIFPINMTKFDNLLVVANHFFVEIVFYSVLAFGLSRPRVGESYISAKVYVDRFASVVLGALGVRLLISR